MTLPTDGNFSVHPAETITTQCLGPMYGSPSLGVRKNELTSLFGAENLWSQLPQKARNRAQTLRSLIIHTRGNNMGLALNHHISTSSPHRLIAKPLSLLFPSSLLSFLPCQVVHTASSAPCSVPRPLLTIFS